MFRCSAVFLLMAVGSNLVAVEAGEPKPNPDPNVAPVEVTFFFSTRDKHLAATEKALADAVKQMPQIHINRVSIDDKDGYAQMAAEEKAHGVPAPGEMLMTVGPAYYLTSKGDARDIELYFASMMKRVISPMQGDNGFKQRLAPDVAAYAKLVFGKDAAVTANEAEKANPIVYYPVTIQGRNIGWVVDAYKHIECPICSDSQFLLAADANLSVIDVRPVRELERLASKLPDAETAKFVAQFKGKSPANAPVKVDAISRATRTSFAYQAALNEILEELKKRAGK